MLILGFFSAYMLNMGTKNHNDYQYEYKQIQIFNDNLTCNQMTVKHLLKVTIFAENLKSTKICSFRALMARKI